MDKETGLERGDCDRRFRRLELRLWREPTGNAKVKCISWGQQQKLKLLENSKRRKWGLSTRTMTPVITESPSIIKSTTEHQEALLSNSLYRTQYPEEGEKF